MKFREAILLSLFIIICNIVVSATYYYQFKEINNTLNELNQNVITLESLYLESEVEDGNDTGKSR